MYSTSNLRTTLLSAKTMVEPPCHSEGKKTHRASTESSSTTERTNPMLPPPMPRDNICERGPHVADRPPRPERHNEEIAARPQVM